MELLDYEKEHIEYLKEHASECALFLKRNEKFPIEKPCKVCLVGNGVRHTVKGGTGSGDVCSRFFKTIEEAFKERGFEITSSSWLDQYDSFKKKTFKSFIRDGKRLARKNGILSAVYSMGFFEEEKNYDFPLNFDGDICVYVLSRNSGEGNDRRNINGDVKLSDTEIKNILFLRRKFEKFLLVLNVGGVIDLSPLKDVENILLLSQLGVVTSDILPMIILGETNPSGKLSTTWAVPEEYPFFKEFGNRDDTYYKEGIYVGYRYFSSLKKDVLFPFGFGLSYTDFEISTESLNVKGMNLDISCSVKNVGKFSGKEVVQVYVTKPNDVLDNPLIDLIDYRKTNEIKPFEKEKISFSIDFTKLSSYDSKRSLTLLLKGEYIIRIGNSSSNLTSICKCVLKDEVILEKVQNKCGDPGFDDLKIEREKEDFSTLKEFILDLKEIVTKEIEYKDDSIIEPFVENLSNEDLINICLGHYTTGLAGMVGNSCQHVIGGAGETTLRVTNFNKSLTMADGPAGIRIKSSYGKDSKGIYDITLDPMMEKMINFLPKISRPFIMPPKNRHGEIFNQFTTAIPIGTALAQSFNDDLISSIGRLVAKEMVMFNVDLWLAPALNIHRNILCGRNFEYYSEDPYLSGRCAIAITKGIQENPKLGVTIKHFACNNQEFNRNNNNSHVSERTCREIYFKGFEMCVKEAKPKALMTSYNLLNGVHTSESHDLIMDILRNEWKYEGLIMTDWIASGRSFCIWSKYPAPYAYKSILAGNDLTMPGCPKDVKNIKRALKKGKLTRNDLMKSSSRIYRAIMLQKEN